MGGLQERALTHPLDPLDADEIEAAAALAAGGTWARTAASSRSPCWSRDKRTLLEWEQGGGEPDREAEVVILDRSARETVEATVAVGSGEIIRWVRRADIQPMAVVSELVEAEQAVLLDPDFQAAMARRGVTDMGTVQVDAWPAGHFGPDEETGQRLCRAVAFLKPAPGDSEWAHPVDGRDRAARPEHARGAAGGRPRGGADPARERQLRRRPPVRRCATTSRRF